MKLGLVSLLSLVLIVSQPSLPQDTATPQIRVANIGNGIRLHYIDEGHGMPVIFVHGSISDGGYWSDQVPQFAKQYRAIAYSRRYNYPNHNPARPGYSAIVDADDLASLIKALHLRKAVIIGHSYGAYTGLFLAARHPELVSALVLAEPPAVSLLGDLPPDEAKTGDAMLADIQTHMVGPMKTAFAKGEREKGVSLFVDYVYGDPHAWDKFSASSRAQTMRDAHEWDVMMTTGTLFPEIAPAAIRHIDVPVLIMTGDQTYPFLKLIDGELARLLPDNQSLLIHGVGHQMWMQEPLLCGDVVETFLRWAAR
jgi:non-heme chloroperoxidase